MPVTLTCAQCGTEFSVRPRDSGRKFCGQACYHAYEAIHGRETRAVEPVHFTCARCGTPFSKNPGELRSYQRQWGKDPLYCSRKCAGEAKRSSEGRPCIVCGKPVPMIWNGSRTMNRRNILCSHECRSAFKVAELARLKPLDEREITRQVARHGYIRLHIPRTPERKGYTILEHRYVMERMLGRPMTREETVHHKNGQRTDNRPENLDLRSSRHGPGGDVSAMIRWAHEFIARYPQFDAEGNFHPVNVVETAGH